ncbi:MAG: ORF6N domain-containing protein [Verrucomicrobia bacterium]|nr:ORF6N domain-containing protein [Verrucomicrobiota bacterium]
MKATKALQPAFDIASAIQRVRGKAVLLDMDLARIYGVPTKRLNEQVKRNLARFPDDFAFQLTAAKVHVTLRNQLFFDWHVAAVK